MSSIQHHRCVGTLSDTQAERVEQEVFQVIGEFNHLLPEGQAIEPSRGAPLFSEEGGLDSMGLVNFIMDVEKRVSRVFDRTITIAEDDTLVQEKNPFRTVGSLVDHVNGLLNRR